ncbi:Holo-[acyl carrier protein] synthase [Candidatus Omnitrophus magneticus]|uniref:Holo-[acyl-carrier-protein] synthase n=1 Tax=Candidatus Omnitrophus magneticus TaxID=1609969 RepID=A0A0F0CN45_9BACT|nr:Holo-[acyl carrier protein] synthase [Candidatus Omnitrophus magneticus]
MNNILGIGIDALSIPRFSAAVEKNSKKFFKKIFTAEEIEHGKTKKIISTHMAGKFAGKEAVKKALPEGALIGLKWRDIEILNNKDGKPYVILHGRARKLKEKYKVSEIFISISHTDDTAIANAVVIGG